MDLVAAFTVFVRVAELSSFSAASRVLAQPQSAVSRQIAALEQHFGIRLLQRTTRRVTLTEDGRALLGHARSVLDAVEAAEAAVGSRRRAPSGLVHIGTPLGFGLFVSRRMRPLFARYPDLAIEVTTREGPFSLLEEGLDLAVRLVDQADSSLVARGIGSGARVLVAAPDYLARRGIPSHPADIAAHECIVLTHGRPERVWSFRADGETMSVPVRGAFSAGNVLLVRAAALEGVGIALLPDFTVQDDVASGRLCVLLSAFDPGTIDLEIVYPSRRNLAPRTRVVIDFLAEQFRMGFETGMGEVAPIRAGG